MTYRRITLLLLLLACRSPNGHMSTTADFAEQRSEMVRVQLEAEGIRDRDVLDAIRRVPREKFVPADQVQNAYRNGPLPIGHGQTISQPYIVAYMTEALELKRGMKVLEIGTGSAYQTAVLAEIGAIIYTIEIVTPLCNAAATLLQSLRYKNVHTRCGNGYLGWPEAAPFERIVLTAAPPKIPQALLDQLAEGGLLLAPVGADLQYIVRLRKQNGRITEEQLIPVRFVPMVDR